MQIAKQFEALGSVIGARVCTVVGGMGTISSLLSLPLSVPAFFFPSFSRSFGRSSEMHTIVPCIVPDHCCRHDDASDSAVQEAAAAYHRGDARAARLPPREHARLLPEGPQIPRTVDNLLEFVVAK